MLWLVVGAAVLALLLFTLRAFERASVTSIRVLFQWILALSGITLALLMLLSGRGFQALTGLALAGPMLWRRWQQGGTGFGAGPGPGPTPPPRPRQGMSREEAHQILGVAAGATEEDIRAAHRRLMRAAHPDSGGSDWLASRINQARDVLLG